MLKILHKDTQFRWLFSIPKNLCVFLPKEYDGILLNHKTAPLETYYNNQQKFHSINGIGTIEEITARLTELINSL